MAIPVSRGVNCEIVEVGSLRAQIQRQYRGLKVVKVFSDIFAVGCIGYDG